MKYAELNAYICNKLQRTGNNPLAQAVLLAGSIPGGGHRYLPELSETPRFTQCATVSKPYALGPAYRSFPANIWQYLSSQAREAKSGRSNQARKSRINPAHEDVQHNCNGTGTP